MITKYYHSYYDQWWSMTIITIIMITKYQGKAVCLTDYRSNGQRLPSSASSVCHFNFLRGSLESEVGILWQQIFIQVSAYAAVSERADALAGRDFSWGSICVELWKCQKYHSLLCWILKNGNLAQLKKFQPLLFRTPSYWFHVLQHELLHRYLLCQVKTSFF